MFFIKNMPYKHFILDIQALGCWKGCLAFGWRSQFWVNVANFLDVMKGRLLDNDDQEGYIRKAERDHPEAQVWGVVTLLARSMVQYDKST